MRRPQAKAAEEKAKEADKAKEEKAKEAEKPKVYIPQRGVQRKQGVVIYMTLYTSLLYNTTPIHCTPLPLHPPVMNTHRQ